jgi:hypothetical protein
VKTFALKSLLVLLGAVICVAADHVSSGHVDYFKWEGSPSDWKIEASLDANQFKVGDAIPLNLTTTNISATTKTLVSCGTFMDYAVEVFDANGKPVSPTDTTALLRGPTVAGSLRPLRIEPGAVSKGTLALTKYFVLSAPGRYSVRVKRYYSYPGMISGGRKTPKSMPSETKPVTFTLVP